MVPKLSLKPQRACCSVWCESDWAEVLTRVPQGSILGPLLADDTSIYIINDDQQIAAFILNIDFDTINLWANDWPVDFQTNC